MKRASDVPPLVLSSGRLPVTSSTAAAQLLGERTGGGPERPRVAPDLEVEIGGQRADPAAQPRLEALLGVQVVEADVEGARAASPG